MHNQPPLDLGPLLNCRLSLDEVQEFPLAIVGMNITVWVLNVLQQGKLDATAAREGSVTVAANRFMVGCWHLMYTKWKESHGTMAEAGHLMKAIEEQATSDVKGTLRCCTTLRAKDSRNDLQKQ